MLQYSPSLTRVGPSFCECCLQYDYTSHAAATGQMRLKQLNFLSVTVVLSRPIASASRLLVYQCLVQAMLVTERDACLCDRINDLNQSRKCCIHALRVKSCRVRHCQNITSVSSGRESDTLARDLIALVSSRNAS
jgi:hypothetical protein